MVPDFVAELKVVDGTVHGIDEFPCGGGRAKDAPVPDVPPAYQALVDERELDCDFDRTGTRTYPVMDWNRTIPATLVEDGDLVFQAGSCGSTPEVLLYDKGTKAVKYARISRSEKMTVGGIEIVPTKKGKIGCSSSQGICVYAAEFEIDGLSTGVLEPGQVHKGDTYSFRYLDSGFVENSWVEDFSDHFTYDICFGDTRFECEKAVLGKNPPMSRHGVGPNPVIAIVAVVVLGLALVFRNKF